MKTLGLSVFAAAAVIMASPAIAERVVVQVDARAMPWDPRMNTNRPFGRGDGQPPRYVSNLRLVPDHYLLLTASGLVTVLPNTPTAPLRPRGGASADQAQATLGSAQGASLASNGTPIPESITAIGAGRSETTADRRTFGVGSSYTGARGLPRSINPARATLGVGNLAVRSQGDVNPDGPLAKAGSFGPAGQPYRAADGNIGAHGTVFPSYHLEPKSYPAGINALLGAFVDADGVIVGKPFKVGARAIVRIPRGSSAIALGLNSEIYDYNRGAFTVTIDTRVPTVTVEPDAPIKPDSIGPRGEDNPPGK